MGPESPKMMGVLALDQVAGAACVFIGNDTSWSYQNTLLPRLLQPTKIGNRFGPLWPWAPRATGKRGLDPAVVLAGAPGLRLPPPMARAARRR